MSSSAGRRLAGRTVVVTRSPADGAELVQRFEAEGARVLLVPTIQIVDAEDGPEVEAALGAVSEFDAIILGSQNAAERLLSAAQRHHAALGRARFFVVGEKTAAFVLRHLPEARVESPEVFRAEALVAHIRGAYAERLAGRRFLFPRAPEGRELILESLEAAGASVTALPLYHIASAAPADAETQAALETADVLTFMSGRTLEHWFRVLPEEVARRHLARATVAVIGPVSGETAERLGVHVDIVPAQATAEALVEAVASAFGGQGR